MNETFRRILWPLKSDQGDANKPVERRCLRALGRLGQVDELGLLDLSELVEHFCEPLFDEEPSGLHKCRCYEIIGYVGLADERRSIDKGGTGGGQLAFEARLIGFDRGEVHRQHDHRGLGADHSRLVRCKVQAEQYHTQEPCPASHGRTI